MTLSPVPVPASSAPAAAPRLFRARPSTLLAAAVAPLLALGLAACAPEPGSEIPDKPGPTAGQGSEDGTDEGGEGPAVSEDDPSLKSAELPKGFPSDDFPLPDDAVIDDAGARDPGSWFVVLRAPDAEAAQRLWLAVAKGGHFTGLDKNAEPDPEASATLRKLGFTVDALMIPQDDGSVLLSYDLTAGEVE